MPLERASADYMKECDDGARQFSDDEALAVGRMVLGSLTVNTTGPLVLGLFDHRRAVGVHTMYGDEFRTVKIGRTIHMRG